MTRFWRRFSLSVAAVGVLLVVGLATMLHASALSTWRMQAVRYMIDQVGPQGGATAQDAGATIGRALDHAGVHPHALRTLEPDQNGCLDFDPQAFTVVTGQDESNGSHPDKTGTAAPGDLVGYTDRGQVERAVEHQGGRGAPGSAAVRGCGRLAMTVGGHGAIAYDPSDKHWHSVEINDLRNPDGQGVADSNSWVLRISDGFPAGVADDVGVTGHGQVAIADPGDVVAQIAYVDSHPRDVDNGLSHMIGRAWQAVGQILQSVGQFIMDRLHDIPGVHQLLDLAATPFDGRWLHQLLANVLTAALMMVGGITLLDALGMHGLATTIHGILFTVSSHLVTMVTGIGDSDHVMIGMVLLTIVTNITLLGAAGEKLAELAALRVGEEATAEGLAASFARSPFGRQLTSALRPFVRARALVRLPLTKSGELIGASLRLGGAAGSRALDMLGKVAGLLGGKPSAVAEFVGKIVPGMEKTVVGAAEIGHRAAGTGQTVGSIVEKAAAAGRGGAGTLTHATAASGARQAGGVVARASAPGARAGVGIAPRTATSAARGTATWGQRINTVASHLEQAEKMHAAHEAEAIVMTARRLTGDAALRLGDVVHAAFTGDIGGGVLGLASHSLEVASAGWRIPGSALARMVDGRLIQHHVELAGTVMGKLYAQHELRNNANKALQLLRHQSPVEVPAPLQQLTGYPAEPHATAATVPTGPPESGVTAPLQSAPVTPQRHWSTVTGKTPGARADEA